MIPLFFVNEYKKRLDIQRVSYGLPEEFANKGIDVNEWGFKWARPDDTTGQPKYHPVTDWKELENYSPLASYAKGRFFHVWEFTKKK
jgi:hypothetical protein